MCMQVTVMSCHPVVSLLVYPEKQNKTIVTWSQEMVLCDLTSTVQKLMALLLYLTMPLILKL